MNIDEKVVLEKLRQHVKNACEFLPRESFAQEPAYVNALLGRLAGDIELGQPGAMIQLRPTITTDHGPNTAEKEFGADFALTMTIMDENSVIVKGVLGQAKTDVIETLVKRERVRLDDQCEKMARYTDHFVVLEAPSRFSTIPTIRLGDPVTKKTQLEKYELHEYIVQKMLACRHGDKRPKFIEAIRESKMTKLAVVARGFTLAPTPTPTPTPKRRFGR